MALPPAPRPACRFRAAHEGLVHLDRTVERGAIGRDHGLAQLVVPLPGRVIDSQAQLPHLSHGVAAVLLDGHVPDAPEPQGQGLAGLVEDRPRGHRGLMPAGGADVPVSGRGPGFAGVAALRADKPLRPAQLGQVGEAVLLAREGCLELQPGLGEGSEHHI